MVYINDKDITSYITTIIANNGIYKNDKDITVNFYTIWNINTFYYEISTLNFHEPIYNVYMGAVLQISWGQRFNVKIHSTIVRT